MIAVDIGFAVGDGPAVGAQRLFHRTIGFAERVPQFGDRETTRLTSLSAPRASTSSPARRRASASIASASASSPPVSRAYAPLRQDFRSPAPARRGPDTFAAQMNGIGSRRARPALARDSACARNSSVNSPREKRSRARHLSASPARKPPGSIATHPIELSPQPIRLLAVAPRHRHYKQVQSARENLCLVFTRLGDLERQRAKSAGLSEPTGSLVIDDRLLQSDPTWREKLSHVQGKFSLEQFPRLVRICSPQRQRGVVQHIAQVVIIERDGVGIPAIGESMT